MIVWDDPAGVLVADGEFNMAGASFQIMKGLDHFPMSENSERFKSRLPLVLQQIRSVEVGG